MSDELALGNLTTVQLDARHHLPFLEHLLASVHDEMTLSSLPPQDAIDGVFIIPKTIETAARTRNGWDDDLQWTAVLHAWGADAVNILSAEAVLRLMELGRVKAELAIVPPAARPPLERTPVVAAPPEPDLSPAFAGPYDWHLACCRIPAAWTLFAATPAHRAALPWRDIRVGHIDTGYSEHAALGWSQGSSETVRPALGYDFFDDDDDPRDPFLPNGNPGHGTGTSATIAGFLPGAARGPFYGAAPGATIVPFRVTDSVIIDHVMRHVAAAIRAALDRGCQVINICLGGLFRNGAVEAALDAAYERGVIVVCAAGNIWGEVIYPGRYNRCVTMGGIGPDDLPWGGSARGKFVDLCGPAQQVRRVQAQDLPPGTAAAGVLWPPDGTGTSYATALCSGVAALWLAWHGEETLAQRYPAPWQRAAAFKTLLRRTARVPPDWNTEECGSGILDAEALLRAPLPDAGSLHEAAPADAPWDPLD